MIANYHTHTTRCRHAYGSEEEYIQAAIERGLAVLGFSDHTPSFNPDDYRTNNSRMLPEELPEYVQTLQSIRMRWAGRITIPIGVEAEYHPDYFPSLVSYLKENEIEYLLLGQHMVAKKGEFSYSAFPSADVERLKEYCYCSMKAMNTGLFTYFAHPDILHFTGEERVYRQYMRELCREAKRCQMPLELNLTGIDKKLHYPRPVFWEIAAEEGCLTVLGCDAHRPESLLNTTPEQQALDMVRGLNLTLAEKIEIVAI